MSQSLIRAVILSAFAMLAATHVSALPLISDTSQLVVPAQGDAENQEIWQDLRPDVTPPEAAVGKEGQTPREWEKARNQTDCEKAAGIWDAPNNKCTEKR